MEWQPINTMPADDGSDVQILVWWKRDALADYLHQAMPSNLAYANRNKRRFSAWMPFPPPPPEMQL